MKTCWCCLTVYDLPAWRTLPLSGYYDDDVLDDAHPSATTVEMRTCHCTATLSIDLPRRKPYNPPTITKIVAEDPRVQAILHGEAGDP
jgi:hypothetical protein